MPRRSLSPSLLGTVALLPEPSASTVWRAAAPAKHARRSDRPRIAERGLRLSNLDYKYPKSSTTQSDGAVWQCRVGGAQEERGRRQRRRRRCSAAGCP